MAAEWVESPDTRLIIKGDIAISPSLFGAWEVWHRVDGQWDQVQPPIYALKEVKEYNKDASPPYSFYTRSRDEVIAEAKKLAEKWGSEQKC